MDTTQYEEKMKGLLEDPIYMKVRRDPTPATERKVKKELKNLVNLRLIPRDLGNKINPTTCRTPKLYGLPKIHKVDNPMRPIVSCIGSPTYQLAKYVTSLIAPLTGQTTSFVKNSQHFVEMVREEYLRPEEVMVSFDIKSVHQCACG